MHYLPGAGRSRPRRTKSDSLTIEVPRRPYRHTLDSTAAAMLDAGSPSLPRSSPGRAAATDGVRRPGTTPTSIGSVTNKMETLDLSARCRALAKGLGPAALQDFVPPPPTSPTSPSSAASYNALGSSNSPWPSPTLSTSSSSTALSTPPSPSPSFKQHQSAQPILVPGSPHSGQARQHYLSSPPSASRNSIGSLASPELEMLREVPEDEERKAEQGFDFDEEAVPSSSTAMQSQSVPLLSMLMDLDPPLISSSSSSAGSGRGGGNYDWDPFVSPQVPESPRRHHHHRSHSDSRDEAKRRKHKKWEAVVPVREPIGVYCSCSNLSKEPLLDALEKGVQGIKVDVSLVDGELLIGKNSDMLDGSSTLDRVFLDPLYEMLEWMKNHDDSPSRASRRGRSLFTNGASLHLFLELHTSPQITLQYLLSSLSALQNAGYLTTYHPSSDTLYTSAITVSVLVSRATRENCYDEISHLNPRSVFADLLGGAPRMGNGRAVCSVATADVSAWEEEDFEQLVEALVCAAKARKAKSRITGAESLDTGARATLMDVCHTEGVDFCPYDSDR